MKKLNSVETIASILTVAVLAVVFFLAPAANLVSAAPVDAPAFGYVSPGDEEETNTNNSTRDNPGTTSVCTNNPDGTQTCVTYPDCTGNCSLTRSLPGFASDVTPPFGESSLLYSAFVRMVDSNGDPLPGNVQVCFPNPGGSPHIYAIAFNPTRWVNNPPYTYAQDGQLCTDGPAGTYALFD